MQIDVHTLRFDSHRIVFFSSFRESIEEEEIKKLKVHVITIDTAIDTVRWQWKNDIRKKRREEVDVNLG